MQGGSFGCSFLSCLQRQNNSFVFVFAILYTWARLYAAPAGQQQWQQLLLQQQQQWQQLLLLLLLQLLLLLLAATAAAAAAALRCKGIGEVS